MKTGFRSEHWNDADGNPAGGCSYGTGFAISWQNGPLGCGQARREPNGAFVEALVGAVVDRLEYYQTTRFACDENEAAIALLKNALAALDSRTADREARSVEGTHGE